MPKPNGSRLPNNTYALAGHTWRRSPEAQLWVPSTPRTLMPCRAYMDAPSGGVTMGAFTCGFSSLSIIDGLRWNTDCADDADARGS
ncbi:MAG: hypothetical protein QSU88_12690, partial [Candidatus Methanoperedens sp.]|nr:hypothetical protein [Candidatus Methanoperedens sp.]